MDLIDVFIVASTHSRSVGNSWRFYVTCNDRKSHRSRRL